MHIICTGSELEDTREGAAFGHHTKQAPKGLVQANLQEPCLTKGRTAAFVCSCLYAGPIFVVIYKVRL